LENWNAANDPCTLELGTGWHVPGQGMNIAAIMNDINSAIQHPLHLRAAGHLARPTSQVILSQRGSSGQYWSKTLADVRDAWYVWFQSTGGGQGITPTRNGKSIRCIKDMLWNE